MQKHRKKDKGMQKASKDAAFFSLILCSGCKARFDSFRQIFRHLLPNLRLFEDRKIFTFLVYSFSSKPKWNIVKSATDPRVCLPIQAGPSSVSRPSCCPAQCVGINRERKQRISGCWQMLFGGRIGLPVWVGWWGDDAFPANTFPRDNRLDDTLLDHWMLVILPCQLVISWFFCCSSKHSFGIFLTSLLA